MSFDDDTVFINRDWVVVPKLLDGLFYLLNLLGWVKFGIIFIGFNLVYTDFFYFQCVFFLLCMSIVKLD